MVRLTPGEVESLRNCNFLILQALLLRYCIRWYQACMYTLRATVYAQVDTATFVARIAL